MVTVKDERVLGFCRQSGPRLRQRTVHMLHPYKLQKYGVED